MLRNISKVSAAAPHAVHRLGVAEVLRQGRRWKTWLRIRDIGNYFDRAEYLKWKSFRESDDARYIGLTLPRFLARLPYGPDTAPVRAFNYEEAVKGPDHNALSVGQCVVRVRREHGEEFHQERLVRADPRSRRQAVWSKICRSTCTTSAPVTRPRSRPKC